MATKAAILSDTHGVLSPEVLSILKDCDHIIHAGDLGSESVLDTLRSLGRIYAVKGNCDGRLQTPLQKRLLFKIEDVSFLMSHMKWDLKVPPAHVNVIITGHTHVYQEVCENGRLWLNPGSVSRPRDGSSGTMVIMNIDGAHYEIQKILL